MADVWALHFPIAQQLQVLGNASKAVSGLRARRLPFPILKGALITSLAGTAKHL